MRFVRLNCPSCKKPIQIDIKEESGTCPYCGNKYVTENLLKDAEIKNSNAAKVKKDNIHQSTSKSYISSYNDKNKNIPSNAVDYVTYDSDLHMVVWKSKYHLSNCISEIEILSDDNKVVYRDIVSDDSYIIPNQKVDRKFKARVRIAIENSLEEIEDDTEFGPWVYSPDFFVKEVQKENQDDTINTRSIGFGIIKTIVIICLLALCLRLPYIAQDIMVGYTSTDVIEESKEDSPIDNTEENIVQETSKINVENTDETEATVQLEATDSNQENSAVNENNTRKKGPEPLGINGKWDYDYELRRDCLVITEILEDGNAYNQGFFPGDIILSIDNYEVRNQENLTEVMNNHYIGEPFLFIVKRDNSHMIIQVNTK